MIKLVIATSGINGAGTNTQILQNIPDSSKIFYDDSAKSARKEIMPELTRVLAYNSASAVEWIQDKFQVDLSIVSRLGGHSQPRTHRGKEAFPGMTITYALMEKMEELCEKNPEKYMVVKKAQVTSLIKNKMDVIVGCKFDRNGSSECLYGPVILSTGGYASDFSTTSLLQKFRPELVHLPTTNGDHCTGDGIKMTLSVGGNLIHMDKVQGFYFFFMLLC